MGGRLAAGGGVQIMEFLYTSIVKTTEWIFLPPVTTVDICSTNVCVYILTSWSTSIQTWFVVVTNACKEIW